MLKNGVSPSWFFWCFFSASTTYRQSTVPIIVTIHQVPAVRVSRRAVTICEKFWVKWAAHHFIGMMFKIITTKSIIATKSNTRATLGFPNHSTILSYLEMLHHHPPNSAVSEWGNHDSSHSRSILCSEGKPQKNTNPVCGHAIRNWITVHTVDLSYGSLSSDVLYFGLTATVFLWVYFFTVSNNSLGFYKSKLER